MLCDKFIANISIAADFGGMEETVVNFILLMKNEWVLRISVVYPTPFSVAGCD